MHPSTNHQPQHTITTDTIMQSPILWHIPSPSPEVYQRLPEKTATLKQRIHTISERYQKVKFASSLAVEDMVITHIIAIENAPISVFTLATGKLNPETLALAKQIPKHYPQLTFNQYTPNPEKVNTYIAQNGEYAFYNSVAQRRECCHIRKIEPLNQALKHADAWLTGQRREQSITRQQLNFSEHDATRNIAKFNPIFDWSEEEVWAFILHHHVPFNDLYHKGFPSIGCEPCTMPVKQGEDIRAGRWWWENRDSKECGLHK